MVLSIFSHSVFEIVQCKRIRRYTDVFPNILVAHILKMQIFAPPLLMILGNRRFFNNRHVAMLWNSLYPPSSWGESYAMRRVDATSFHNYTWKSVAALTLMGHEGKSKQERYFFHYMFIVTFSYWIVYICFLFLSNIELALLFTQTFGFFDFLQKRVH